MTIFDYYRDPRDYQPSCLEKHATRPTAPFPIPFSLLLVAKTDWDLSVNHSFFMEPFSLYVNKFDFHVT
jgi:hypothetical protein